MWKVKSVYFTAWENTDTIAFNPKGDTIWTETELKYEHSESEDYLLYCPCGCGYDSYRSQKRINGIGIIQKRKEVTTYEYIPKPKTDFDHKIDSLREIKLDRIIKDSTLKTYCKTPIIFLPDTIICRNFFRFEIDSAVPGSMTKSEMNKLQSLTQTDSDRINEAKKENWNKVVKGIITTSDFLKIMAHIGIIYANPVKYDTVVVDLLVNDTIPRLTGKIKVFWYNQPSYNPLVEWGPSYIIFNDTIEYLKYFQMYRGQVNTPDSIVSLKEISNKAFRIRGYEVTKPGPEYWTSDNEGQWSWKTHDMIHVRYLDNKKKPLNYLVWESSRN